MDEVPNHDVSMLYVLERSARMYATSRALSFSSFKDAYECKMIFKKQYPLGFIEEGMFYKIDDFAIVMKDNRFVIEYRDLGIYVKRI